MPASVVYQLGKEKQYFVFLFRTPVRWLKFRPEKPMGEILEEGDKDDGEKKEGAEGEEGAEKAPSEKKDGSTEDATVAKEVRCKLDFITVLSIRFEGGCPSTAVRSLIETGPSFKVEEILKYPATGNGIPTGALAGAGSH